MLLHAGKKPGYRFHKRIIVHDRIPLVTLQPGGRITVMLCQNNCFRICLFHNFTEFSPELVIVLRGLSEVRCHIEPPSVRIIRWGNPFLRNIQNILLQFFRALIIQFRKCIMSPPAIVASVIRPLSVLIFIKVKEAMVWTVFRNVRTIFISFPSLINLFLVKPFIKRTTVVEHTVQDHFHAPLMHLFYKRCKKRITGL